MIIFRFLPCPIVLVLTALGQFAGAQTAEPVSPVPAGPLIQRRASEFSRWTVIFVGGGNELPCARPNVSHARRIVVTKTGAVAQVLLVESDGSKSERWYSNNLVFLLDRATRSPRVYEVGGGLDVEEDVQFAFTDFPGFEWVSKKHYVGTRKVMGLECLVFVLENCPPAPEIGQNTEVLPPPEKGTVVAHVDAKTRLPVLLQKNGMNRFYQFEAPPQAPLSLPKKFCEFLEYKKGQEEKLARMPERPF